MGDTSITLRFNEIYDSTKRSVLSFVTAKCRNTADIHDIVQDTYVELYIILDKRGAEYVKNANSLVLRIARQKLYRYYSLTERLKMFLPMSVTNESGEEAEMTDFEADSFLVEEFVTNQIMLEEIKQLLKDKPQDVKKVFYLFYDVDLSIPQIAKSLSMSESNVKHKLYRTLNELRALLK